MSFKKAERRQAKLKIGISGPSGSGKTLSALLLASGIGTRIAVIDTENNSASLYSDRFDFDTLNLSAPFLTQKYLEAMQLAEKEKYDVVIIDSATHQWMGAGGLYERKTEKDARGGNSFTNWAPFTPEHNRFLSAIIQHQTHLIVTVRSKQDYNVNEKGRPDKIGLAPVQREGFEYELTTMFDLSMNHSAQASKDRTGLFDQKIFTITKDTGIQFKDWIESAKKQEPIHSTPPSEWSYGPGEREKLKNLMEQLKWDVPKMRDECKRLHSGRIENQLNESEFSALMASLQNKIDSEEFEKNYYGQEKTNANRNT